MLGVTPTALGLPAGTGQEHPVLDEVRDRLADLLAERGADDPGLVVLTGLRLGAEMAAAEAAVEVGVPFVAVLPYPEPAAAWPEPMRKRFEDLLAVADEVVVLDEQRPSGRDAALASLARRDAWLAGTAGALVLVGDDTQPEVAALRALFSSSPAGVDIHLVDPGS